MLAGLSQQCQIGVLKFNVLGSCPVTKSLLLRVRQIQCYVYISCHIIPRSELGTPFSIALASFSGLAAA